MRQNAALEVGANLALDEASDGRIRGASPREEGQELRANDGVEKGLIGLMAFVSVDGAASARTGSAAGYVSRLRRRGLSRQSRTIVHAGT